MVSQITGVSIVYSNFCSGADQRKHQSSASLPFIRGIHRWSVNSPNKGPVTRKMFSFDDVIMLQGSVETIRNQTPERLQFSHPLNDINILRPRQNGRHSADDIFKCIFLDENIWSSIELSVKFVLKDPINNSLALVQIMAWRRPWFEAYLGGIISYSNHFETPHGLSVSTSRFITQESTPHMLPWSNEKNDSITLKYRWNWSRWKRKVRSITFIQDM